MSTTPQLLARAMGLERPGDQRCYYCGGRCDDSFPAQVKDTFNDRAAAACPRSTVRCGGCEYLMTNGVPMAGREKPQKPWTYSWVITPATATPLTKADLTTIRGTCLAPPAPPYAIVIAASGQKHIAFRTPAGIDRTTATVGLEGETISYHPDDLRARLWLSSRVAAAAGKPALTEELSMSACIAIFDRFEDGEDLIGQWSRVWTEPLSRLAAFLTPKREDCQHDHPSDRTPTDHGSKERSQHGLFPA